MSPQTESLYLVDLPKTDFYVDLIPKEMADSFSQDLENILKKYPSVKYIDLSGELNEDHGMFLNATHLNYLGAEKISKMLNLVLLINQ